MDTQPDVEKLIQKTKRYEFLDGLRDLQLAIVILALGIVVWFVFDQANVWLRLVVGLKQTFGGLAGWLVVPVVLIPGLLGLLALPVMHHLRQRWLWRDSGIVSPKRQVVPRRVTGISAAIALAGLVLGVMLQWRASPDDLILLRLLIVSSGWSLAFTLVAMGRLFDLPRYKWTGLAGGLVSTFLLLPALTVGQTALIWGVIWCVLLIVSGAGRLYGTTRGIEGQS